jgi:hypothetical protein
MSLKDDVEELYMTFDTETPEEKPKDPPAQKQEENAGEKPA